MITKPITTVFFFMDEQTFGYICKKTDKEYNIWATMIHVTY